MKKELLVRELGTDRIIHRVDVSTKSNSVIEKVMLGMLRNMDTDKYYIDDTFKPAP